MLLGRGLDVVTVQKQPPTSKARNNKETSDEKRLRPWGYIAMQQSEEKRARW